LFLLYGRIAGNGSDGVVFEVVDTQQSFSFAMKVQQSTTDFQREIKIMGQMNSVQLVKLLHGEVYFIFALTSAR
jgi:hypothetical protein